MSDLIEVNRNINTVNTSLQTLTDQVATLAVSMDRLIQTVEQSERSIERALDRLTQTVERSEQVAERNANTIAELVGIVNRMMAERE